jgi:hypothetical protein
MKADWYVAVGSVIGASGSPGTLEIKLITSIWFRSSQSWYLKGRITYPEAIAPSTDPEVHYIPNGFAHFRVLPI